ncbi:MAG: hypothetical protein P4L46_13430 [Fimbriimonas sp.]|nr:hypothetical protein [Fimbriimonas sp.]
MKRILFLTLLACCTAGCNMHKDLLPFLGKWSGKFQVRSIEGGGSSKDVIREEMHGYIQVYETGRSYKMELQGEQETIDVDGTWAHKANRIILSPKSIAIDDMGGAESRDPNKKYIPADQLRDAYSSELVLTESKDNKALHGLEMTIGRLIGKHEFIKDSF